MGREVGTFHHSCMGQSQILNHTLNNKCKRNNIITPVLIMLYFFLPFNDESVVYILGKYLKLLNKIKLQMMTADTVIIENVTKCHCDYLNQHRALQPSQEVSVQAGKYVINKIKQNQQS